MSKEVAKILNSIDNIKHKTILMLVYSAGLRVGELVKLKPEDIDPVRNIGSSYICDINFLGDF
mgnify:CR=1